MKSLETERLVLRKLRESDFDAIHSYASCLENLIYMPFGPNTGQETRNFIKLAISLAEEDPIKLYQFAVVLKETDSLIGGCSIGSANNTSIGWLLHRDYWRQGYGYELARELLRFGFEELNLHRIRATCDAENVASYSLMEKIGMRREALFIESNPPSKLSDKQYSDELVYAILKREWEGQYI